MYVRISAERRLFPNVGHRHCVHCELRVGVEVPDAVSDGSPSVKCWCEASGRGADGSNAAWLDMLVTYKNNARCEYDHSYSSHDIEMRPAMRIVGYKVFG